MPTFEVLKKSEIKNTFHDKIIADSFTLKPEHLVNRFIGEIPIENTKWNIGLIVGSSGTGKTTIMDQLWPTQKVVEYKKDKSIIGNFPDNANVKEITDCLSKMGLNSPPLWLQEYHTLSNGEKMRANLALNLFQQDFFVFDEFTSVVDRTVARITSHVVQKYIRNNNKQFIAIACHDDIIDWLQPDWIFDTNKMEYLARGHLQPRPKIKLTIKEERGWWGIFRRYHYLSEKIHPASRQFIAFINNRPVAFTSYLYRMGRYKKNEKRRYGGHRLVCLPDYQGIGLGAILNELATDVLFEEGKRPIVSFSNTSLYNSIDKTIWKCIAKGHKSKQRTKRSTIKKQSSAARYSWSFEKIKKSRLSYESE